MTKYKTVLFDWEGVMGPQDTEAFGWLMDRLLSEYNVTKAEATQALGGAVGDFLTGSIDNHSFWEQVGSSLHVQFSQEFQDTIWQQWHGALPIPEMQALVQEVKQRGLRVVVFSNILAPSAARIRENGGYDGFDALVLSYEAGERKPQPGIYQKAIEAARCQPKECIFIDDKISSLKPAQQLGMTTILAKNTKQISRELRQLLDA